MSEYIVSKLKHMYKSQCFHLWISFATITIRLASFFVSFSVSVAMVSAELLVGAQVQVGGTTHG